MLRLPLDLDVTAAGVPGLGRLAADLLVPDVVTSGPLVVCFPGGGMGRRYFDLPATAGEEWSMAAHLVDRFGLAVALVDHPATGDSDVPADPWCLVPTVVADIDAVGLHSLRSVCEESAGWTPTQVIGCGHSMGGMIVVRMQERHRVFDAVALLGFGNTGLPAHVPAGALAFVDDAAGLEAALPQLTRERFGVALRSTTATVSDVLAPDAPADARTVIAAATTDMLALCALAALVPNSTADAMRTIDVPVFVGVGEHDIAGAIEPIIERFPAAPIIDGFVLPGAGHNHTISRNRTVMYDAVGTFVADLTGRD